MFACFRKGACKNNSPSPKKPNLPANMLRTIAQQASPGTRRAMSRATTPYTRRTLPIGLAVTKVGGPIVPRNRPPVVNRSRATAKTPKAGVGAFNWIDQLSPQAYKNNAWRFYLQGNSRRGRQIMIFLNTPRGNPFTFNKVGRRVPITHLQGHAWRGHLRQRRPTYHTWGEYQKRLAKGERLRRGRPKLMGILRTVDRKVKRFVNGDRHALDDVPFSLLIMWANTTEWMNANGKPYVKNIHNKIWRRYGSQQPLNKNMILNNINLMHSMRLN
jgi:hypothetical protein